MACYQVTHVTPSDPPYILQSDADTSPSNYMNHTHRESEDRTLSLPFGKLILTSVHNSCSTWLDIYIMFKCSQLKLP